MTRQEIIARLETLEAEVKPRIESAKTSGKSWDNYITNAPSRLSRVVLARALTYHDEHKQSCADGLDMLYGLLTKSDWDYQRLYCADPRFQKWVDKMQAKAPEKSPIDWE